MADFASIAGVATAPASAAAGASSAAPANPAAAFDAVFAALFSQNAPASAPSLTNILPLLESRQTDGLMAAVPPQDGSRMLNLISAPASGQSAANAPDILATDLSAVADDPLSIAANNAAGTPWAAIAPAAETPQSVTDLLAAVVGNKNQQPEAGNKGQSAARPNASQNAIEALLIAMGKRPAAAHSANATRPCGTPAPIQSITPDTTQTDDASGSTSSQDAVSQDAIAAQLAAAFASRQIAQPSNPPMIGEGSGVQTAVTPESITQGETQASTSADPAAATVLQAGIALATDAVMGTSEATGDSADTAAANPSDGAAATKPAAPRAPVVSDVIAAFLQTQAEAAQAPTQAATFGQTISAAVRGGARPSPKQTPPGEPPANGKAQNFDAQPQAASGQQAVPDPGRTTAEAKPAVQHPATAQRTDAPMQATTPAPTSIPDGGSAAIAPSTPAPASAAAAPAVAAQVQVTVGHHDDVSTLDRLGLAIATKSADGVRHFDIRLDPPELGRVQVHLSVDDSGRAQANLIVDKPQTLELLQRDSSSLNRALSDAGLNLPNNGLNFSLREQYRQNDDGGVDKGRGRALSAVAVVQTDASQIHSSLSHAPHSVRVDIRV